MENTIATLKAEMVNELEFIPKVERVQSKHNRYNYNEVSKPFDSKYFNAKVSVKVGNAVGEVQLKRFEKYISSHTDKNGKNISSHYRKFLGIDENPFKNLEDAGIKVDFSTVKEQYADMVEKAQHTLVLQKRLEKWESIRKVKAAYPNSWMHNFESVILSDNNKKIKAAVLGTTFQVPTLDEYIKNTISLVKVTYRGYVGTIRKSDGSYEFNNAYGETLNKNGYFETLSITDGKTRKAKREGTIFLKFVEAVDNHISTVEYKKSSRQKEIEKTEETKRILEEVTGYPVYMEETREYSRHRNDHSSWLSQKYFLITEQPDSYYGSFKGIKIDTGTKGYDEKKVRFYNVGGLTGLRQDQFQKIVKVLVDGRKIYDKVVTPEKPESNY